MPVRTAEAQWQGNLRDGKGTMEFGGGAFKGAYSSTSRFEEGTGTNPEELIAAAHAGCFSMALSHGLASAGFAPKRVHTTARLHLDKVGDGWKITRSELRTEVEAPGLDQQTFQQQAEAAKKGCPVSHALAAIEITLDARLVN